MFLSEQIFLSNSCQPILCSTFKVPLELVLNQSQHIGNKQRHGQSSVPEYTQKLEEGRIHNDEAQSKDTTDWTEQTNRLLRWINNGRGQRRVVLLLWNNSNNMEMDNNSSLSRIGSYSIGHCFTQHTMGIVMIIIQGAYLSCRPKNGNVLVPMTRSFAWT